MARSKKNGAGDALIEAVARMPWWVGVTLAVVAYLGFRHLAGLPPVAIGRTVSPEFLQRAVLIQLSKILQWVVAALCLIGALVSVIGRRKSARLLRDVAASQDAGALNGMSWREFEMLVGESFRMQGYTVQEIGGAGADGGVDLVLRQGGELFLVQCKQWKSSVVDVKVVRELYGVMAAQQAAGGFVVTSGRFTSVAVSFAAGKRLTLIDGPQLHARIRQVQAARGAPLPTAAPAGVVEIPGCPSCGAAMVLRTASKGARAGDRFWGCSRFPACRGTRSAGGPVN